MEKIECGVCYEKPEEIKSTACCKQMICVDCYPKCKKCPFCRDAAVFNPDYKPQQENLPSYTTSFTVNYFIPQEQAELMGLLNPYDSNTIIDESLIPLDDFRDIARRTRLFPEVYGNSVRNLAISAISNLPIGQMLDLRNSYLTINNPDGMSLSDIQSVADHNAQVSRRPATLRVTWFPQHSDDSDTSGVVVPTVKPVNNNMPETSGRRKRHYNDPVRHSAPRNARGRR